MYVEESMASVANALEKAGVVIAGDRGIFDKLREEHATILSLLSQVGSADADTRRELYPRLRRELLAHGMAEEKEFYSVMEHYRETELSTSHSRAAHDQLERFISRLDELASDDPAWGQAFDELASHVTHHIQLEESELIPTAQTLLSDDISQALARRFAGQKARELHALERSTQSVPFDEESDHYS